MIGQFEDKPWAGTEAGCRAKGLRSHLQFVVPLLLLVVVQAVHAGGQSPQAATRPAGPSSPQADEPNELWWSRWDARIGDPNNPNELLEAKWNAIVKVLQVQDLDHRTRERIIDKIVSPVFDFPLMGQLALGRTHWPKLDAAQREKFIRLFVQRLKALYLEKTTLYTNENAVLKPGEQKKSTIQILMTLVSNDKERTILYKLRKVEQPDEGPAAVQWKVYDVEIEGVSILLTYRSQFDDILRRGTVESLLSHLESAPAQ